MWTQLAAFVWIFLCSAAGATPNPWHKPVAYFLIALIPAMLFLVRREFGAIWALMFLCVAVFQLRLLLKHWLKRLWRHLRSNA